MNTLSRTLRRAALVVSSVVALSACGGIIGPSEAPPKLYVLRPQFAELPNAPSTNWQLDVAQPTASDALDSKRITLIRGQNMDYFADAAWTDQAPDLLQSLIIEAFEKSGKIKAVGRSSAGVRGDLLVVTELRDFSAHYETENGIPTIVVEIVAKLVTSTHHDVVASYDARHEVKASVNSVPAVVDAFNLATGQTIEDVVGWALGAATPAATDALPPTTARPAHRHRRHH
jgi:cholesterol transport system auxiliary component